MLNQKLKSIVSLLGASYLAINSLHAASWTSTGLWRQSRSYHTATLQLLAPNLAGTHLATGYLLR